VPFIGRYDLQKPRPFLDVTLMQGSPGPPSAVALHPRASPSHPDVARGVRGLGGTDLGPIASPRGSCTRPRTRAEPGCSCQDAVRSCAGPRQTARRSASISTPCLPCRDETARTCRRPRPRLRGITGPGPGGRCLFRGHGTLLPTRKASRATHTAPALERVPLRVHACLCVRVGRGRGSRRSWRRGRRGRRWRRGRRSVRARASALYRAAVRLASCSTVPSTRHCKFNAPAMHAESHSEDSRRTAIGAPAAADLQRNGSAEREEDKNEAAGRVKQCARIPLEKYQRGRDTR
jgi:hypothetical protein